MQWNIGSKLIWSFLGMAFIGLVTGAFGYYGVFISEKAIHEIGSVRLPAVENLLIIAKEAENIRGNLLTLSIAGLDEESRMHQYANIEEACIRYQANEQYLELNHRVDDNGIAHPEQLGSLFEQFTKDHYVLVQRVVEMLLLNAPPVEGGDDAATCNIGRWMPIFTTKNPDLLKALQRSSHLPQVLQ